MYPREKLVAMETERNGINILYMIIDNIIIKY